MRNHDCIEPSEDPPLCQEGRRCQRLQHVGRSGERPGSWYVCWHRDGRHRPSTQSQRMYRASRECRGTRPVAETRRVSDGGADRTEEARPVCTNPKKQTLLYPCVLAVRAGLTLARVTAASDFAFATTSALVVVSFAQRKVSKVDVGRNVLERLNLQQQQFSFSAAATPHLSPTKILDQTC